VAFKLYLGISPSVTNWNTEENACTLVLEENPLVEFVELSESYKDLVYCQVLCGLIRGALEMVQIQVKCNIISDTLSCNTSQKTELRVEFVRKIDDELSIE